MSLIAPTLEAFFTQHLMQQRQASPNTIAAYGDAFRLLFRYLLQVTGKRPSAVRFEDLDAATIGGFLLHLENHGASVVTRNARLSAIHSLFQIRRLEPSRACGPHTEGPGDSQQER